MLAACAGRSSFVPSSGSAPFAGSSALQAFVPDAVPGKCKGQKTTAKYASNKTKLSSKGGQLCVPAIAGWGGTIAYPAANPSVTLTLTTSTTNYNGSLAPLAKKGKPIFYIQLGISGATSFGANTKAGGGLASKTLAVGKSYTVYGDASAFGQTITLKPCWTKAVKSPYGGQIGGIGTLLKNQNVPVPATGLIELYAGKSAASKC
jgi:hypothetical protein